MNLPQQPSRAIDSVMSERLNRRQILRQTSVLGLSLPAVGGLLTAQRPAPVGASATTAAVLARAPQGELVIAIPADTYATDFYETGVGMYPNPTNMNMFETLATMSSSYELEPMLAESWEMVDDDTWRFTLRQDVKFHDGTPLTTEAIPWWLERMARVGLTEYMAVVDATVIDDYTFEINTSRPNRRLVEMLVSTYHGIEAPGTELTERRVGTGPFKEVEYVPEDHYTVEAFADYWGDLPKVERITFRFIPDPTTRVLALQAGEAQISAGIPREATDQLASSGDLRVVKSNTSGYEALLINRHGPEPYVLGQDAAVREAIAYAIDKQAIIDGVFLGNAELSPTMVPADLLGPYVDLVEGTTFDPERARQVLDESGWVVGGDGIRAKDGQPLKLTLVNGFPAPADHGAMPELVQAQLRDVGIDVEIIQTSDLGSYDARLEAGEGDLFAETAAQYNANPCGLPHEFFVWAETYKNRFEPGEDAVAALQRCVDAPTTEEAQQATAEALHLLVDEEFAFIPLAATYYIYGASGNVEGFEPHGVWVFQRWTDVSLSG